MDIVQGSRIREPSEITDTEVTRQLAQARRAIGSARMLLDPGEQARLLNAGAEGAEFTRAMVSTFADARYARTPDAAADVIVKLVTKLRSV